MMRRWLIVGLFLLALAGCGGKTQQQKVDDRLATIAAALDEPAPGGPALDPAQPPIQPGKISTPTPLVVDPNPPEALEDIDLAPILAAEGDLPAGYALEKPTTQLQSVYGQLGVPLPDATLTQIFANPDAMSGFAAISLYGERSMLSGAYTRLVQNMGTAGISIGSLGEQATQSAVPAGKQPQASVVFVRCRAVVMLQGYGATSADPDQLVSWGQKIDRRIQASSICQK
jgi:hypothetical protein